MTFRRLLITDFFRKAAEASEVSFACAGTSIPSFIAHRFSVTGGIGSWTISLTHFLHNGESIDVSFVGKGTLTCWTNKSTNTEYYTFDDSGNCDIIPPAAAPYTIKLKF